MHVCGGEKQPTYDQTVVYVPNPKHHVANHPIVHLWVYPMHSLLPLLLVLLEFGNAMHGCWWLPLQAYRAVLLDQDVLHRLSPPSVQAGTRPRYSLVWKLVFFPRHAGQALGIARPEWGPPCAFGSAAKAQAVMRQLRRGAQAGKAAGSTGVREDEEHMPKRYRREGTAGDG